MVGDNMDDFDLGKEQTEGLESLKKQLSELEIQNEKLKEIIRDNDLEDELEDINVSSMEEKICYNGIRYIASLVEAQDFDDKDIRNFDTLFKVLRTIQGKSQPSTKKMKKTDITDALKIVKGING